MPVKDFSPRINILTYLDIQFNTYDSVSSLKTYDSFKMKNLDNIATKDSDKNNFLCRDFKYFKSTSSHWSGLGYHCAHPLLRWDGFVHVTTEKTFLIGF